MLPSAAAWIELLNNMLCEVHQQNITYFLSHVEAKEVDFTEIETRTVVTRTWQWCR